MGRDGTHERELDKKKGSRKGMRLEGGESMGRNASLIKPYYMFVAHFTFTVLLSGDLILSVV